MNIAKIALNGAVSQFGREFGRAAANQILKGANGYTVNSRSAMSNPKTISSEIDGTQLNDDEQQKMVHSEVLPWYSDWFYFAWFPLFFGVPYIFLCFKYVRLSDVYNNIINTNKSDATCWYNIKVADGRTKTGYRIERELIVTKEASRTLFEEEKVAYARLLKQATFRKWFSAVPAIIIMVAITMTILKFIIK